MKSVGTLTTLDFVSTLSSTESESLADSLEMFVNLAHLSVEPLDIPICKSLIRANYRLETFGTAIIGDFDLMHLKFSAKCLRQLKHLQLFILYYPSFREEYESIILAITTYSRSLQSPTLQCVLITRGINILRD
jgi:hypothetical protein